MATTLTPYTRNHPVNLLRCSCCCSRCCLKSNTLLHTPNHVGLSCGIVVFRPPRSRRWLVVVCHHQQSLARYAVLMRSSSESRLSSLPAAVGPPSPLSSAAVTPLLLMLMVGRLFPLSSASACSLSSSTRRVIPKGSGKSAVAWININR